MKLLQYKLKLLLKLLQQIQRQMYQQLLELLQQPREMQIPKLSQTLLKQLQQLLNKPWPGDAATPSLVLRIRAADGARPR